MVLAGVAYLPLPGAYLRVPRWGRVPGPDHGIFYPTSHLSLITSHPSQDEQALVRKPADIRLSCAPCILPERAIGRE